MRNFLITLSSGTQELFKDKNYVSLFTVLFVIFFALFGIGFGGVVFVLNYRWYFVVGITILMLIAIYLTFI